MSITRRAAPPSAHAEPRTRLDAERVERLRSEFDVIPIVRELSADTLTPVSAFTAIASDASECFLLESVERGESLGRYSFIGFSPRKTLSIDRGSSDAPELLRRELVPLRVHRDGELPPFFGGAVGWFGYGAAAWSETIPDSHDDPHGLPDAQLLFFDQVVVFDHLLQRLFVVANLLSWDPRSSSELVDEARQRIDEVTKRLGQARADLLPLPAGERWNVAGQAAGGGSVEHLEGRGLESPATSPAPAGWTSNVSPEEFVRGVAAAKEEIAQGEIFQIVLSQRWETEFPTGEDLTLYRALRSINPSPYMFLLRTSDCSLVGASPEMLVRLDSGVAETRPIAGTRPRGMSREEDAGLERELLEDAKENAEHLMLVDLGRNDLGRVCQGGSVRVTRFRDVERYSHVMHLVSDVEGRLREGVAPIDLFLSAFPAGTVSGAPKIRAMELIDRFEPDRRGPYAGAIAYFGFSGNLDSCIAIRTILLRNGVASVQAGAGIVHDSVPQREYEETTSKSAALRRAVELARAALIVAGQASAGSSVERLEGRGLESPATRSRRSESPATGDVAGQASAGSSEERLEGRGLESPATRGRRSESPATGVPPRIVVIDNYDSFTWNLVQMIETLTGTRPEVLRNDAFGVDELLDSDPDAIVISPGPGTPENAGRCVELIRAAAGTPLLGVCLGHQAIAVAFGGRVSRAPEPMHGKVSRIEHEGRNLFENCPRPMEATRYHSLAVESATLPSELSVDAVADGEVIMAISHRQRPVYGIQFHPESHATHCGELLLRNFLREGGLA